MKKILFFILLLITSCGNDNVVRKTERQANKKQVAPQYSYKVFFMEDKGWGYQIFKGATILINQEHIPAIQGLHYFSSKENAEKTATFILSEVEKGHFPPTLNQTILDSLGVLN